MILNIKGRARAAPRPILTSDSHDKESRRRKLEKVANESNGNGLDHN